MPNGEMKFCRCNIFQTERVCFTETRFKRLQSCKRLLWTVFSVRQIFVSTMFTKHRGNCSFSLKHNSFFNEFTEIWMFHLNPSMKNMVKRSTVFPRVGRLQHTCISLTFCVNKKKELAPHLLNIGNILS